MHSTCVTPEKTMIIAGGRNEKGTVLSDVWELAPATASAATEAAGGAPLPPLAWRKRPDLALDVPRCAHGAAVVTLAPDNVAHLCIIGGFTGLPGANGMPDGLRHIALHGGSGSAKRDWSDCKGLRTVGPRFGVSVCNATSWITSVPSLTPPTSPTREEQEDQRESFDATALSDETIQPPPSQSVSDETAENFSFQGLLLFGGVNVERDFADVWLVTP